MAESGQSHPDPQLRLRACTRRHGPTMIIEVDGEIDHATADLLREHVITAALAISPPHVVLDFDQVTFCDSSGLGALIAIWKAVRAHHGDLVVARPPGVCRRILERTGLDRHITIHPTLEGALRHA
ncbi:STAS domain-containing protein [Actinomadura sp. 3N508]|uniref:STAS domain-containing protein n=1 Tax=Actinomadura sp. 3N508 TaxID=3375153 RepID=UPI0037B61A92